MERLSQKEMGNHKANMSSITVMYFGKKHTIFSIYKLVSLNQWWKKFVSEYSWSLQTVMGENGGKQEEHAASLKAVAGVVGIEATLCTCEQESGNQLMYTELFKQFCHHNPKCL